MNLLKTDNERVIRNAIAGKLNKEPNDLTNEDYDSVTNLDLFGKNITNIMLLKQCKNLKKLYLAGTTISDISPLAGLTNMTKLYLHNNQINDISSLTGLINMIFLTLSNNQISDILPLVGLKKLKVLDIKNCEEITDKQVDDLHKALPDLRINR